MHAAPCASLSGSYRGYDYRAHSLFLRFHWMPPFRSLYAGGRLPVFDCSKSLLYVSIEHYHKPARTQTRTHTHMSSTDSRTHRETKQLLLRRPVQRTPREIHSLSFPKVDFSPHSGTPESYRYDRTIPRSRVLSRCTRKIAVF